MHIPEASASGFFICACPSDMSDICGDGYLKKQRSIRGGELRKHYKTI